MSFFRTGLAFLLTGLFLSTVPTVKAGESGAPDGYRMDDYRAPVPAGLGGARVLESQALHDLWLSKSAIFIDVLPKTPTPQLPKGTVFRLPPRDDIPGSVWLPDVGYGVLSLDMADYFQKNLDRVTQGDKSRTLVFYCLADCWMSWNAAKRALSLGYRDVIWYPEGTDGWSFEGYELQRAEPVPRPGIVE